MDIVQMVLCGKVNKDLVSLLQQGNGGRGVGLSGMDGNLIEAVKPGRVDHGNVGNIVHVNRIVLDVLDNGYIPVIATSGRGRTDHELQYQCRHRGRRSGRRPAAQKSSSC
ncbi:MAG: hypothetical protein V8T10_09930 [Merdibacter sp.]